MTTATSEIEKPAFDAPVGRYLALLAATCSIGAAIVHFAVMGSHWSEWWLYGVFFMVCAWGQIAFAAVVLRRGPRWALLAGGIAQFAIVLLWVVTRTSGLPFGPDSGTAEAAGLPDTLSSVLEVVAGAAAIGLVAPVLAHTRVPREAAAAGLAVGFATVVALTTLSLTPAYVEHHHDDGESTAIAGMATSTAATGHSHGTTAATTTGGMAAMDMSGMSGMDMSAASTDCHHSHAGMVGHKVGNCTSAPVTAAQQAAADALVQKTISATAKWPTIEAAEKAGYTPTNISGPLVHMGNYAWSTDDDVLDPQHPEDLVYMKLGGRSMLLGAMYVMRTQEDQGPLIGGALTSWHIHTNLCVDAKKYTAFNPLPDGSCAPGSKVGPTTQMLHVWTVPYPGGPFADIDPAALRTVTISQFASRSEPDTTKI